MIGRAVRHLAPDSLRRISDGVDPRLHELVHLLCCARCADALQRYERADDLAQEIACVLRGSEPLGEGRVDRRR